MSKGNMLLGYARGKVGSMVFRRSQGEQIVSAYNGNPLNNRTSGQMQQRATFLCASKFFTRGVQNLFRFAFEDKKQNESDFNAFMRNNAKRGIYFTRPDNEEPSYPAIGPFMMTKGRLTPANVTLSSDNSKYIIALDVTEQHQDWGKTSQEFISKYGCRKGDIITVCLIEADGSTTDNTPQLEPEARGLITWIISQAAIDPDSELSVSEALGDNIDHESTGLTLTIGASVETAYGFCAIISRPTPRGLQVSTSYLVLNKPGQDIYKVGRSADFREAVLEYWRSSPDAILEGKEAKS